MDIHERYKKVLTELEEFLAEDKFGQETGQWFRRLADIHCKLVSIEAEAIGMTLARLKEGQ